MRKWKDNENKVVPKFVSSFMIAFGILGLMFLPFDLLFLGRIDLQDITNFGLGLFAILAGKYNGLYRISRAYAEWQLKKKDNKWRNS